MTENYEDFSESQVKILNRYVTNTNSNVFVLRNLPEVIKGALFSRYSRSSLGLRSLLLKDFILNEETAFASIAGLSPSQFEDGQELEDQITAIKKAQTFYDRILDGYGDDSIGELGGAHLAVENISMIAAKKVEDARIGGSPLEKSTRYIYFDQKTNGEYLYYREPIIMTSAYRDLYIQSCDKLFETYAKLIPPLTELMQKKFPKEREVSQIAYNTALRAKVCDCLRGLLPASALTNLGIYGNGRFFETLIQGLNCESLAELQEIGKKAFQELHKVIPSFIRRSDPSHKHQKAYNQFRDQLQAQIKSMSGKYSGMLAKVPQGSSVRLVNYDPKSPTKVAAALLFGNSHASLHDLKEYCSCLPEDEIGRILDVAAGSRENRRHKSPRGLEHAEFTFEITADYGSFRDLHRHRMLTQERQLLTCDLDYFIPEEILKTEMEKDYRHAMEFARKTYDKIAEELPEEAQYCVPMAYNINWYFHVNLRALQWICEIRSAPAGHPNYRAIAQEMAKQVSKAIPSFERFFKFVDYEGYVLGRLGAEIRSAEKFAGLRS